MNYKICILCFFMALSVSLLSKFVHDKVIKERKIGYSKFIEEVESENIKEIVIQGNNIFTGYLKKTDEYGKNIPFRTIGTVGDATLELLDEYGVKPHYLGEEDMSIFIPLLICWGPVFILFFIVFPFLEKIELTLDKANKVIHTLKKK